MPSWKKVVASGSDASFSSLTVDTYVSASSFKGSFTGSLQGTSSWAVSSSNAISSSYALTASYALFAANGGGGGISAIYILDEGVVQGTASYFDFTGAGVTATVNNQTASIYIPGGGGGSNTNSQNAILSQTSPAVTWSFTHNLSTLYPVFTIYDNEDNVIIPQKIHAETTSSAFIYFSSARTGTAVASKGGDVVSASFSATASLAYNAISASYAYTASSAVNAKTALTASSADSFLVRNSITASNALITGTVTAQTLVVQTVTSSIIYSSGSNIFGNDLSNRQTFTGSVDITGSLTVDGMLYPTTDGIEDQFLSTNGAGTLSFANVRALYQNIRNMETSSIVKGTPLFASGSTGDNVNVYIADAINPLRMPATLIAGDNTLASLAAGRGIILGHIEGVNTTGFPAGTEVYVGVGGSWTATRPTGSAIVQSLGVVTRQGANGMGIVLTVPPANLPNIAEGQAWVGNVNGVPIATATSSFSVANSVSASYSATASYLLGYISPFPFTGSAQITGSLGVTGSLNVSGGITGSLFGSASWSQYAVTASYSLGGSGFPYSGSAVITGSFLVSQSFVDFSNASYVTGSLTGSLFGTASYATFALSASFAPGFTTNMSQSIAATTWSFTHNLNTINPIVQVYDLTNSQIIPNQIVGMNNSTAEIRFDYAQAGYAVASNGGGLYVTGSTSTLVQTVGAVTWSFTHNLNNKYNTYEVYDNNDYVLIPSAIKAVDNNNVELHFATSQTGRVVGSFSGINGSPNAATASYANTASFVSNLNQNVFITGSLTQNSGFVVLTQVSQSLNYVDDVAAAAGGVPLGGIYRNGNFILIRLS